MTSVLLVTKGLDIGGIERIVVDLAIGLHQRGEHVEVAVVNSSRGALTPALTDAGVTVHALGGTDRIGFSAMRRLSRLVRNDRFGVVHVHGPLPAALTRLVPGHRPIVSTSHTPWTSLHVLTKRAWRLTAGLDAATIAVSTGVADSLPRAARQRTTVIPHGISAATARRAIGEASAAPTGNVGVIVVASHRDAKNYPNLIRAIKVAVSLNADIRVVAVGEGPGLEAHRRLASDMGLDDVIAFESPTPDILPRIASHDLLVVASDYEGQPLVVSEAFAVGVPVIATSVGRVPELVTPDVGRVVPTRDPEALGHAIAELASDPGTRRTMGLAALERSLQWTMDDVVKAHLAVYDACT